MRLLAILLAVVGISGQVFGKTYATGLVTPSNWLLTAEFNSMEGELRADPLPAEFDWAEQVEGGFSVRNQGSCGSCWAFGSTAVLEALVKISTGKDIDLSEQQLLSCNHSGYSCNGGYFIHDFQVDPGQTGEADFPYVARKIRCKPNLTPRAKLASWGFVGTNGKKPTTDQIKAAIHQYGPVAVTVNATSAFMNYKSGVFSKCSSGSTNHMVMLTGWSDSEGAWKLHNSWATKWGQKGLMDIKYGCNRVGEVTSYAVLAE